MMDTLAIERSALAMFDLPDHRGSRFSLRTGLGPLGTLIVFYRGHWCPYCRRYLTKLQANADRFAQHGITLVGISPEPVETSRRLAAQLHISFPLLSDPDGTVIDQYGTRNGFRGVATAPRSTPVLPHPAVFLVDSHAILRYKSIDRNFKRRTTMHTLFTQIEQMRQPL